MTAAGALGRFVVGLDWDGVAPALRAKVEDHVLDTLGVICAGAGSGQGEPVARAVARWGGVAESVVVASERRLPAPGAAFVNAFHGRILTYDDTFEAGPLHTGAPVIAAALASAEAAGASGADFLAAVLAGYEVATRVSAALGPSHYAIGFHGTGTCTVFGACAAAARARRLDAGATADALGLAGEAAAGLRQHQIDGAMSDSALNGARAAMSGIVAAELRVAGLAGPHGILDGPFGIAALMARDADAGRISRDLGREFLFEATALKPYPSCRFTHGPVQVLLDLRRRHGFGPSDVEAIEIATFRQSIEVSDRPHVRSATEARLSHQFVVALALVRGAVDLGGFADHAVRDPTLLEYAGRVRVVHDRELEERYPAAWPHRVAVRLRGGAVLTATSDHPPGGTVNPLARPEVVAKFRANATPALGESAASAVVEHVGGLARAADVSALARALHRRGDDRAGSRAASRRSPRTMAASAVGR